jgi:membrane protein required for colicin V production
MNTFDAVVIGATALLALLGFRAGLMRSVADILGFVVAVPVSIALTARFASAPDAAMEPAGHNALLLLGAFVVTGFATAQLLRLAIGDLTGNQIHLIDRSAGFALGIARALLVAVLVVLAFDRIIPAGHDPAFLKDSRLRPVLSMAGQHGMRSLPPEIAQYIDRLKQERGI